MGAYSAVATTTAHASRGVGGTGPDPGTAAEPGTGSAGGGWFPSGASTRPAGGRQGADHRRLTTPARLWIALIAAVTAFLAIGGTCAATLATRQAAQTRASGSAEPLVQNVNLLYHALAEADATAATALLVGPVPPTRLLNVYNDDISQAVTALSTASRELAGDDAASAQLAKVAGQLPLYTAYIATAQADNRQGFPVAGAYLREASTLMHSRILAEVQAVSDEESAAQRSGLAAVSGFPIWITVVGLLALIVLARVGRELRHSTRRRANLGLAAGLLIAVSVVLWSLVAVSSAASAADRAQGDFGRLAATLGNRDSLARVASYQSLALVDRGEDNGNDTADEQAAFKAIGFSGLDDVAGVEYRQLNDDLNQASRAIQDGDYEKAIDLVVGHGPQAAANTVDAYSAALDGDLVAAAKADQAAYAADAGAAGSALSGGLWAGLIGGVLAAFAAAYGINKRLAEYR